MIERSRLWVFAAGVRAKQDNVAKMNDSRVALFVQPKIAPNINQPLPSQIVLGVAAVEVPNTASYIERAWTIPASIVYICTKAAWISVSKKRELTNEGAHRWLNAFSWKSQTALLKRPAPMSKRKFVITTRKTVSARKNRILSKVTSETGNHD
jgi:hypothetical protein